jgi:hypothetical protein
MLHSTVLHQIGLKVMTYICIREVLSLNPIQDTDYRDSIFSCFSSVSPGNCQDTAFKQVMTASFQILSNLPSTICRYTVSILTVPLNNAEECTKCLDNYS